VPNEQPPGQQGGAGARPRMNIYDARKPRRRRRARWKRIALWSSAGMLLLVLAAASAVGIWAHTLLDQIGNLSPELRQAQGSLDPQVPTPNQPAVALVIGSDHRPEYGHNNDGRSDTLMLVRSDPAHKQVSMLSLPRDLYVDIPGHGMDKINAAYSDGGVPLALKTVEAVTGVKVNYLIVVDFSGFTHLVDNFDGVYVPVDQHYYHVNTPGTEQYSQIDIPPGYQRLDGKNALAYARYRHTDSDFYRNARQQTFLQAFQARTSEKLHGIGLDQLGTMKDVAETVAKSVQVTGPNGPPSVQTLISYAGLAYNMRGHVVTSRLDATTGMVGDASVVEATPDAIRRAVYTFEHPWTVASPTSQIPTGNGSKPKTPKFKPKVDPSGVSLTVVNGNGRTGSAGQAGHALQAFGYGVDVSTVPAPTFDYNQNWVYYHPGSADAAADVAQIMGHAQTAPLPASFSYGTDLVVVVGKPFTGTTAIKPPKQKTAGGLPSDIVRDDQAYLSYFQQAAQSVKFPVLYPTVQQTSSQFDEFTPEMPIRVYNISAAGSSKNSMYSVFAMPNQAGAYWGIEETKFTDAPILKNPAVTRQLDGRTYQFWFDGKNIHLIAIVQDGTAYWVINTLRDDLSNQDMVAIARSLEPVH
jgi:LCP family protein required for cell wall assembly